MLTKVIKITDAAASASELREAARILREGGLVVFPTETVYGLGGDGTDDTAAKKIYAAKGRPSDNPLIIHIASPEYQPRNFAFFFVGGVGSAILLPSIICCDVTGVPPFESNSTV